MKLMKGKKMTVNKLGKVEFIRKDFDNSYYRMISRRARSITRHIKNDDLFDILCHFILNFCDQSEYMRKFSLWMENIKGLYRTNKIIDMGELEGLIDSLKRAYDNSRNDQEISDLRGRILEVIYQDKLSPIYSKRNSVFDYGCEVIINGLKIIYIDESGDSSRNRTTIDIAGYNIMNSEFYELKVRPNNFKDNVLVYLNTLKQEAVENEISKSIKVGCVSMESKVSLKKQLEIIKRKYNVEYDGLELIGRDEIKQIL